MAKLSFEAANASQPLPFNGAAEPDATWVPKMKFFKEHLGREYRVTAVKSVRYLDSTSQQDVTRVLYRVVLRTAILKTLQRKTKKLVRKIKSDDLKSSKVRLRKRFRSKPSRKENK